MPLYDDTTNLILNTKSNLKHVVNYTSNASEVASGEQPVPKAYVRSIESANDRKEKSTDSLVEVAIPQDTNLLNKHEAPQSMIHDTCSDPKMLLIEKSTQNARCATPQPFTVATDNCDSSVCKVGAAISANDKKQTNLKMETPNLVKTQASIHLESRKPLQPDNEKHIGEDDASSAVSLPTSSLKAFKSRPTVTSAPTFRVSQRAEKWKEFYSMLEQKQQVLEAERIAHEAIKKEEEEAALKELRKNLNFKATPMPSFYQEGPPPKAELKKVPVTRAKAPNFGRRKICGDAYNPLHAFSNGESHASTNGHCLNKVKFAKKSRGNIKIGTPLCKVEVKNKMVLKPYVQNEAEKVTANATMQS